MNKHFQFQFQYTISYPLPHLQRCHSHFFICPYIYPSPLLIYSSHQLIIYNNIFPSQFIPPIFPFPFIPHFPPPLLISPIYNLPSHLPLSLYPYLFFIFHLPFSPVPPPFPASYKLSFKLHTAGKFTHKSRN